MKQKIIYTLLISLFLFQGTLFAQDSRIESSINSNWKFIKKDVNYLEILKTDSGWKEINIPYSYNAVDAFDDKPGYYRGKTWYKKTLYLDKSERDKNIYLYFEGAYQEVNVYVNGKLAGQHVGGFTRFCFDITKLVNLDKGSNENEILVSVNSRENEDIPPLRADFTFYGGIYRDVYLISTSKTQFSLNDFASNGVYITTPEVSMNSAKVNIRSIITRKDDQESVVLKNTLLDAEGKIVLEKSEILKLSAVENNFKTAFDLKNPKLWSIDTPYLYTLNSALFDPKTKKEIDFVSNTLGFRWFSFNADKGFSLNGEHIKLIGTNRHQDYEGLGNALPDYLHYADIINLKKMGGNVLRIAHYPQDPVVLEMCDKLGIVASVEIPIVGDITVSEGFTNNCLNMMEEMVKQNYNHPSVFIWAYMNEILLRDRGENDKWAWKADKVRELAQKIDDKTRALDPYRYTMIPNQGTFEDYYDAGLCAIPMIVGWNLYYGWYEPDFKGFDEYLALHREKLPNKPVLITEYGAGGDPRLHTFDPRRFDFSVEWETIYHQYYLKVLNKLDFVAGGMVWNLNDFGSEQRIDAVPHVNNKGLLSFNRVPKEPYYFYEVNLSKKPVVVIGSKSWDIRSSVSDSVNNQVATMPVTIYSNMASVQLELNGKSLGAKTIVDNQAIFQVPFVDGTNALVAKGITAELELIDVANISFKVIPFKTINASFDYINVDAGSHMFFTENTTHRTWLPDKPYSVGSWGYVGGEAYKETTRYGFKYTSSSSILNTENDPLYQTQRIKPEAYKFDVPSGEYIVELHFAELLSKDKPKSLVYNLGSDNIPAEAKEREFSVSINKQMVVNRLNLTKQVGDFIPFVQKNKVIVTDSKQIVIEFSEIKGDAIVSGISIRKIN